MTDTAFVPMCSMLKQAVDENVEISFEQNEAMNIYHRSLGMLSSALQPECKTCLSSSRLRSA